MVWLSTRTPATGRGYADAEIADIVIRKTEAIKAVRIEAVIPGETLLPTLLAVACSGDRVLDFGGGAGFHYLVASQAFPERSFRWAVVEHPLMVSRAHHLEQPGLKFFPTAELASDWLGGVDLLHSNGVLQYLDSPEDMVRRLLSLRPKWVSWSRLLLGLQRVVETQVAPLSAHGPGPSPGEIDDRQITHTTVRMENTTFMAAHSEYRTVWRTDDGMLLALHQ
jgi:putative methyltransferase (TIGR04325 family)